MLVAEIANILLAGSLLPEPVPQQRAFAHASESGNEASVTTHGAVAGLRVQALQTKQLVSEPLEGTQDKMLHSTSDGYAVLQEAETVALRWWHEVIGVGADTTGEGVEGARRSSLFTLGGSVLDEEIELSVALLVRFSECDVRVRLTTPSPSTS